MRAKVLLTEYEHLDLTPPSLPPRSRLFRLEPVGVGTPYVENLTSYVARLAEAHCVQPKRLFISEIAPRANRTWLNNLKDSYFTNTTCRLSTALNNINGTSAECVRVLESLTARHDLRFLTMQRWEGALSNLRPIRPSRAWCQSCYDEQAADGLEVYDQLLWALPVVRACPRHFRSLCHECPRCSKRFSWLGPSARVGHCANCLGWLGRHPDTSPPTCDSKSADAVAAEVKVAEAVGKLLAASHDITPNIAARMFASNLALYLDNIADGSINRLAVLIGMNPELLRTWKRGVHLPQLRCLLKFCSALGTTVVDLLSQAATVSPTVRELLYERKRQETESRPGGMSEAAEGCYVYRTKSTPGYRRRKINYAEVERYMLEALHENPPLSVYKLGQRLGVERSLLYSRFKHLAHQLSARVQEHRRLAKGELRALLEAALVEYPPSAMAEVEKRIAALVGCRRTTYVWKIHPETCRAIAARHAAHLKECRAAKMKIQKVEVRRVVVDLSGRGIYPSEKKVRSALKSSSIKLPKALYPILQQVRKELGLVR